MAIVNKGGPKRINLANPEAADSVLDGCAQPDNQSGGSREIGLEHSGRNGEKEVQTRTDRGGEKPQGIEVAPQNRTVRKRLHQTHDSQKNAATIDT